MRKIGGAFTLVILMLLSGLPIVGVSEAQRATDSTRSAERLRRDLGEKGQIVIESLDLQESDIDGVVRLLARVAGINIITGDITGSISLYLEQVTVQDALEAILASQGYGFIYDGNIVRVVEAAKLGEDRVETITETFVLNYLNAEAVAKTLKTVFQGQGGTSIGQIEANAEANAIIAVDIPRQMEDIRRMIRTLDRRFEQVEIEGRFVEVTYNQDQDWGIDWQYFQDPANALDVNLAPGVLNAGNAAGQFRFAVISGGNNLNGFLQMIETDNDIKVLASPRTLAIENEEASIELIEEIPFVEANVSQGVITESVQFQEAGIRLLVTPTIAEEEEGTYVTLKLDLEQRIQGPMVVLRNSTAFPIDSRRAMTTCVAPDEATIIIGGLQRDSLTYTYNKVPFLGSIPVLGLPFRRRTKNEVQTELMLFVTPRVIYDHPPLSWDEQERHDEVEKVMDELNTQSDWRARAEAPVDMIDKGIMYSTVIKNEETYDKAVAVKECIEGVKPYKIAKPKGKRRVRITGVGDQLNEEFEYVDEEPAEAEETAPKGEVRDFSIVEEKAEPGQARPVEDLTTPKEEGSVPLPPPPPAFPPMDTAPDVQEKPAHEGPSWLRRGSDRRSDSGDALDSQELQTKEASADLPVPEVFEEVAVVETEPEPFGEELATAVVDDLPRVDPEIESDPFVEMPPSPVLADLRDSELSQVTDTEEPKAVANNIPLPPVVGDVLDEPFEEPAAVTTSGFTLPSPPPSLEEATAQKEVLQDSLEAAEIEDLAPIVSEAPEETDPWNRALPSQEGQVTEWNVEIDLLEDQPSVSPETTVEEVPVLESGIVDSTISSDFEEASNAFVPFVRPEPVSVPAADLGSAAMNETKSVEVDGKTQGVHRVVLKEESASSPPTDDLPVSGVSKVQRVDLRSEAQEKEPESSSLRKYLSPETIAAMQELDSIREETASLGPPRLDLSETQVGAAEAPTDPWIASANPAGFDRAETHLPSTDLTVVPNHLPVLEPASAPIEVEKKSWWKKMLRRK